MSTSLRDLVDGEAELDEDEDDESFDEETGESRQRKDRERMDDSSEEDEDDDDEEEARRIREGFIVDEDEEDEADGSDGKERRRRKKRRRAEREEEEQLDEEDLDLIGESIDREASPQQNKLKRLKRGHGQEPGVEKRGLEEIFSDDDEEVQYDRPYDRSGHRAQVDEFDGFIEEDFPEDEEERAQRQEDLEVARPRDRGFAGVIDTTGMDEDAREDMEAIFGTAEYDWILEAEEKMEEEAEEEKVIELKDVFEPSQLKEKLLTDEDNQIRYTDEPERFQLARKQFNNLQLSIDLSEETNWIANLMWPKKQLSGDLHNPFRGAIRKVLEYFVIDGVEVPYIFQHRKDYLIHARKVKNPSHRDDPDAPEYTIDAEKLLTQDDLWKILEYDIKFRSLIEKRTALETAYDGLKTSAQTQDDVLDSMASEAATMEELQDLQDYVNFQYSAQLKDVQAMNNGTTKEIRRPGAKSSVYERIRKAKVYNFVRAIGISPDRLAKNALREGRKVISDDDASMPIDLADSLTDGDFATGDAVLNSARQMYAEELFHSPRMRKYFRINYYQAGEISCRRTDKGLRKIDESHPFYEIKYLVSQTIQDLARRPELFLKMMKAEEEGLVEVKLRIQNEPAFRRQLYTEFSSDNFSDRAQAWNKERQKVLDMAFEKLERVIAKGVKDSLRTACQDELLKTCREEFSKRLDQAPVKPKGFIPGTPPRVLTFSNGMSDVSRDPIAWVWVEEDGRVVEHGKFANLTRDEAQRDAFVELVERRRPDAIGVSGFSAETHRLVKDLENLVSEKGLIGPEYEDPDTDELRADLLEVIIVNDEVARMYKDSPRAQAEHATLMPLTRYCVALARYMQNPMKEYAALGRDIVSLSFHPCQNLLPQDKLLKQLETAMVDMVNLVGVDINEAVSDSYTAQLLPYVSGLGPRKATAVIKAINANGGVVNSRDELVGDPDSGKLPVVGPRVWNNCASFLYIEYDSSNPASDPLDNTRVHPEDYALGRKMAGDALEMDEEDIKAEIDENGPGAVVRKLMREDETDKVNELVLEEYAEQLERAYQSKKRATLETIRAELQLPYEELRRNFTPPGTDEVFTMFTGETKDSLADGMIVPVNVRVVKDDFAIVKLDCGIEGRIEAHEVTYRSSVKDALHVGQTIQAKILEVNRKDFVSKLSAREDVLRRPYRRTLDHDRGTWDFRLEDQDREELREKDKSTGRTQRVIKHPLFKPFNHTQAEEFLGGLPAGEVVIRSSSRGNDHLTVTWKVADGVYQHIDVLELQKENEFSVGRTLRIGGKYTYTDLDELIVEHVKAMAKKVDEMTQHEKFQKGSRNDLEKWLTSYMDANPNRSTYAFCIDHQHPGFFFLCFKASKNSKVAAWPVKVVPNAFEMMKAQYPDMRALTNGFKLRFQTEMVRLQQQRPGGR